MRNLKDRKGLNNESKSNNTNMAYDNNMYTISNIIDI